MLVAKGTGILLIFFGYALYEISRAQVFSFIISCVIWVSLRIELYRCHVYVPMEGLHE